MVTLDPRTEKNQPGQRTSAWAWVSVDQHGDEGVCAISIRGLSDYVQMIFLQQGLAEKLRPRMAEIVKTTGMEVKLVRFDRAEVLDVIKPPSKS